MIPRPPRLIAAVTGASRGIGRATALALAGQGYRVFALARTEPDLQALTRDASNRELDIAPVVMDITDNRSRLAAVRAILDATEGYGLDVLVNNAGYGQMGALEEIPLEKLQRQFDVNVFGLLAFTQPFLPFMRERRRGWVVNVSSAAGLVATPFTGAYNASKFALEGMSDALRLELSPFNVKVILIEPGPIRANFGEAARQSAVLAPNSAYAHFMGRWGGARRGANLLERSPEAVARLIVRTIQSTHPRPRYTITLPAKLGSVARRLVPDVVTDWFLRRAMGG
jgi:short-subunit dehydrogenase